MTCLYVNNYDAVSLGWTRVGNSPWLSCVDYPVHYVKTQTNNAEIGEFGFDNATQQGRLSTVEVAIDMQDELEGDDKIEVWMWENVSGWEKVGEITPTTGWAWETIDISTKFDTYAKVNVAKMRLKYVGV